MATERIEVTYRIITPMFCGGSDWSIAELRLPSFKGVLRWWWRALAWSRCAGDLSEVRRAEDDLFGSPSGGQSKVGMRLVPGAPPTVIAKDDVLRTVGEGARYLGYGVMDAFDNRETGRKAGQLKRACVEAPSELRIEVRARDLGSERSSLIDALKAVGLLGGLGARSRNGYGSLVLRAISIDGTSTWSPPAAMAALQGEIAALLAAAAESPALPAYTAVSSRTRIVLLPASTRTEHPLDMLNLVGREMMRYRSWGHDGRVLGDKSEKNFWADHDLMKTEPGTRRHHPERIVFGLPHNYGKRTRDKVGPMDADDGDRRASPLLIHIHECDTRPIAVLVFLPARFLSKGDAATLSVGGDRVTISPDPELWRPIDDLLTRFRAGPPDRVEPFGTAVEIRP